MEKRCLIGRINQMDRGDSEWTPTAHNTANTDTHFVEMAKLNLSKRISCVRSIAFAARRIDLLIGGKSNGGVCRNVMRHVAGTTDWNPETNICPRHERLTGESPALASDVIERPFPFG